MRILLGWLLLISLAALAGLIQARWTDGVRSERDEILRARGARTGTHDGWSQVIVGEPSGADPVDVPWPVLPPEEEAPEPGPEWLEGDDLADRYGEETEWHGDEIPPPEPIEPPEPTWQVTVRSGMVLSKLCSQAYGRGTPDIANAVARYNGMADANQLSVGDVILLPPYGDLRDEHDAPLPPLDR